MAVVSYHNAVTPKAAHCWIGVGGGRLADKPTVIWVQKTKTPNQDAFSFSDVKEETL